MKLSHSKFSSALRVVLILALMAISSGCALQRIKKDVATARQLGLLLGSVVSEMGTEGVLVVQFKQGEDGISIADVAELSELQETWGFLGNAHHRYYFAAFRDANGNRIRDEGEGAAFLGNEREIRIEAGGRHLGIHLELAAATTIPEGFSLDLSSYDKPPRSALRFAIGEVVSLDDERFANEEGVTGMWTPLTQMVNQGAGLYFLEDYDPDRIPVLFVHGIGGTPLDSRVLIEKLDKSKFQPWVFFYPSGFRLTTIVRGLRKQLTALCKKLEVKDLYIVAHSMGGLVAKGLALDLVDQPSTEDLVKFFVTFSTPIEGHSAAAQGLKFTPEPVPAWIDMAPGSPFLDRVKQPLPADVPYYLFFGYNRAGNFFMTRSHDSVVDVNTQIPLWAQDQATLIIGFDLDHMAILTEDAPVTRFLEIMNQSLED